MRSMFGKALLVGVAVLAGCTRSAPAPERRSDDVHTRAAAVVQDAANVTEAPVDPGPVRTEEIVLPGDRPAYVVRGARVHRRAMVFLAGMCTHPGGYVMAFQHTAASRGDLVGLQGDVSCGGDGAMRMWSSDLEKLDRRIDAAFVAAGLPVPSEVLVIGYSQGAERAERLMERWPTKYTRAILIASPITPSPARLHGTAAIALMAGSFDIAQARMRDAAAPLVRAGIPARYSVIPKAHHGELGDTPEDTMRAALDFVDAPTDGAP